MWVCASACKLVSREINECIPSLNFVLSRQNCISHLPLRHFQREAELFLACQILGILAVSLHCFSWGLVLFADVCVIHRGLCRHLISCLRKDINKQMAITDITLPGWKMVGWGILFSLQPVFFLSGKPPCLTETLTVSKALLTLFFGRTCAMLWA